MAETYALLAVAEALQFSLGQDWPAGPLLTPVPPRLIGRPTVSTLRSDSSGLRTPNLASSTLRYPVARNPAQRVRAACRLKSRAIGDFVPHGSIRHLPLRVGYQRLAGMVRMLGEDVQAMALHDAYAIDIPRRTPSIGAVSALQASMGSVSTLSSCTSAT